ncbi:BTB/POZ domain-containing protein SR1IP1 [Phoenix dactylifera]|uniref:BTB/POZ domain-containing protein SR1IP1 n=1 Tax=Phoenix dactylifera TaxID=42345 RepID=A0A8B7BX50_PHODC|nr:BTB/POZ domain-containing protein SR1IP1 [Phoenix dactylifera]
MLGVDQETAPPPAAISKRRQLRSTAMKRTSEWILSQEIPSDITIHAGGSAFALHKLPLVSKCGYIRRLVSEANGSNISVIEIPDVPGGAEAFKFAAKFCYGINFEITTENIAMLRCVAGYLEMTEDYAAGNLVNRTEGYLEEVALMSLSGAVTVLHKSEDLLPMAEKVKLVSRCIDAVAYTACKDSQFGISLRTENSHENLTSSGLQTKAIVDWWAEELTVLRIDTFQRVLMAMKARGFKQYALGPVIMLYAQESLRGLDMFGRGRKKIDPKQEHEKRVVLETIVSLLPRERNAMSVSFLSLLLRAAIYLETTVACRLDLEKRMGLQLEQAVLDDLLIPSFSFNGDPVFDVDTVQRIFVNYLELEVDGIHFGYNTDDTYASSLPSDIERVARLMESYLAEIASDHNLTIERFISLAELIPEQARVIEDGMYRAIDIYLKAHPSLSVVERKKVCSLMDCQRLSREACAHAAQNDRLPVQLVVQVLYYEQQRHRDVMSTGNLSGGESPALSQKATPYGIGYHNAPDELSRLRRENADLKLELFRMRMQLQEIEKSSGNTTSAGKPPLPKKSFINSVSKKLGRLYPFMRSDNEKTLSGKTRKKPPKDRRHSIS